MRLSTIVETRRVDPPGTYPSGTRRRPTKLTMQDAENYVKSGSIPAFRIKGYSANLGMPTRGIFYFVGNQGDYELPLGRCLVAYNKVHAAQMLGFSRKFILAKLNYFGDVPKAQRSKETEDRLLNPFMSGDRSFGVGYDHFDFFNAMAAVDQGYDTILIVNEPTARGRGATEIVDLRTESRAMSVAEIESSQFATD